MLTRLLDQLKGRQTTVLMTNLTSGGKAIESTEVGISSLVDNWLLLRDIESNGERNRGMYVLKARGTAHSNQIREFLLTDRGIHLEEVYVGREGVLTGSSRLAREAREREEARARREEAEGKRGALARRQQALEAQIAGLRAQFQAEQDDFRRCLKEERAEKDRRQEEQSRMKRSRKAAPPAAVRTARARGATR